MSKLSRFAVLGFRLAVCCFLISAMGCEAFVRKFTRKPKKENLPKEELVLEPQEYKPLFQTKEELYRKYFLYWKSWHDELLFSLSYGASHKKQLDCASETIKNLESIRELLSEPMRNNLDTYLQELKEIAAQIEKDTYSSNAARSRLGLERLRRNILRDFSYNKIKDHLS